MDNFSIFAGELNIHLKLMTLATLVVTFGDVPIKFEQTQHWK